MNATKLLSITTLVLAAMTASLQADFLANSFETSPVTSPAPVNPPYTSVGQSSSAGVTDGSYSMEINYDNSNGWSWLYTADSAGNNWYNPTTYLNWYNHNKLQFDLHRPALGFGWNLELVVAMQGPQGWQQKQMVNWVWQSAGASSSQTLTWDYTAIRGAAPVPNLSPPPYDWWQFAVVARGSYTGKIYIDNVRFIEPVPEPTVVSLLGLAAAVGIFARGRRALNGRP